MGTPKNRSINYEAKENYIFFSFVCLTTSSDECTSVENKQRNNDDSLMILETVCE
nr:MAG TPA: hypothetical protein [Caudoviricetes sp.]